MVFILLIKALHMPKNDNDDDDDDDVMKIIVDVTY